MLATQPLLYAALFLGVLLLVEGAYQFIADLRHGPRAQINRRIRMIESGADAREILAALRRSTAEGDAGLAGRVPGVDRLERLIRQAGMTVSSTRVLLWMLSLAVVSYVGLDLWSPLPLPLAALFAAGLAVGPPVLYIRWRRRRRISMFGEQLPGALDLLVRSLKVGHPMSAALGIVAQEMPDPIGTEFGIAIDEITYGLDLQEAMANMNERVDLPDLRYMTVAINIQHNSGGNLAEILAALSRVIRDRFQMFRKIKAVSAEGRLSAFFLSIFPFLLAVALYVINPNYYIQVADDPAFPFVATVTAVLLVINIFVMRWLVNLRV